MRLKEDFRYLVASGCVKECKREDLTVINSLKVAKKRGKNEDDSGLAIH